MAKINKRPYSKVTQISLQLFGKQIQVARKLKKISTEELAERAGVSRGLVERVEKGEPGCQIGVAFELATLVGIPLFEGEQHINTAIKNANTALTLLPERIRAQTNIKVNDDF
jgi:transcriptional regulator with XRE-family HTH domain